MEKKSPRGPIAYRQDDEDGLHRFLMADGTIRGTIVDGSRMVNQMRWNHGLGILETLVLGHAYLGACLMSSGLKGRDRLGIQIDCSGPIKGLTVEANADGQVRGFLKKVPIEVTQPLEDFNLSPFFGAGFLSVTRILAGAKQPFTGKVMLAHGNLAKDLAHYYLTSEQIPTAFTLSVKFDGGGNVVAAGGMFLQAMPEADDSVIQKIESHVVQLPSIGDALAQGIAPVAFIDAHWRDYAPQIIGRRDISFHCHCNREQIRNVLTMLPVDELEDIRQNGPFPVEIRCHHCNTDYVFDKEHIEHIRAKRFERN
ncbi:MAG: protein HslO [Deltaproteobacteria bacterium]|nr:MAG: protein HslO [Deltaproteobacteria bacterium]